jgi:putative phage-type endonuclease
MNISILLAELDSFQRIEQKSQQWLDARKNLITASEAGYFLGIRSSSGIVTYIKNKLNLASSNDRISQLPAIKHGNIFEDISRIIYETRHCVHVREYGLITTPKTPFLGASPDGIVSHTHPHAPVTSQSRIGRLIEIKNPYDYDASTTIKPEYLIQIYQQQYVLGITECDFIKTNIIGGTVNNNTATKHGLKPYSNIDEFLADIPVIPENQTDSTSLVNNYIPLENHSSRGLEKGIIIHFNHPESKEIMRVIYPLSTPYKKSNIQQWIKETKNEISSTYRIQLMNIAVEYWYLANYYETTITYDASVYENLYLPRLDIMWKLVLKIREYQSSYSKEDILELLDGALLSHFKAFNTPHTRENKYKIYNEHHNIMEHMKMALLLAPVPNTHNIGSSCSGSNKTSKISKIRKAIKNTNEVIEYDF